MSPECVRLTAAQLPALGAPEGLEEKGLLYFFISKGFTAHEHQEKGFSVHYSSSPLPAGARSSLLWMMSLQNLELGKGLVCVTG